MIRFRTQVFLPNRLSLPFLWSKTLRMEEYLLPQLNAVYGWVVA